MPRSQNHTVTSPVTSGQFTVVIVVTGKLRIDLNDGQGITVTSSMDLTITSKATMVKVIPVDPADEAAIRAANARHASVGRGTVIARGDRSIATAHNAGVISTGDNVTIVTPARGPIINTTNADTDEVTDLYVPRGMSVVVIGTTDVTRTDAAVAANIELDLD